MSNTTRRNAVLALLCTSAITPIAHAAHAQAAAPNQSQGGTPSAVSEVVVTGSHVITNGNNAPTPVTVVSVQQLETTTPSDVPDGLNKLPIFSGSNNQTNAGQGDQTTNVVGNFLNLRGIGPQRTLVLFDGNRVPPSAASGAVDINALPQMILQRVDVVTGGVSAVYGSDAITGVVNFIVDKRFKGLAAEASGGVSDYGDVPSKRFGFAYGGDLGDRGHFIASFEHYDVGGLTSNTQRPTSSQIYTVTGAGTSANPFVLTRDSRSTWINPDGNPGVFGGALAGYAFGPGGGLIPFVNGTPTGSALLQSGGSGGYVDPAPILASLTTNKAYARYDYDLTSALKFHLQAFYAEAHNVNTLTPFLYIFQNVPSTNAYLPPAATALLNGANQSSFVFAKEDSSAPPLTSDATTKSFYVNAGISGLIAGKFNYDFNYVHGQTVVDLDTRNNENNFRLAASLDSIVDGTGQIVCRNAATFSGCVPINPFGLGSESAAAIKYIDGTTTSALTNIMDDVTGNVSVSPFHTWAGPVNLALTGEFRSQSLKNVSSDQPGNGEWMSNVSANAHGAEHDEEFAVEGEVPLAKDLPFAQSVSLNGAVRYANYSTSGSAWTWKAGLDWHVNDAVTLRATRSRDYRAPTIFDLYQPITLSKTGYSDLLTGVSGVTSIQTQGNTNLKAEIGETTTIGIVIQPPWLRGFSASIDYYSIDISNAIATISGADPSIQSQCNASAGASPLCALYLRPLGPTNTTAANYPSLLLTEALNVASLSSHGVDIEINYKADIGPGRLFLRGLASYQPEYSQKQTPASTAINSAGAIGHPTWKLAGLATYTQGDNSFSLMERWRSQERYSGDPSLVYAIPPVHSVAYTDLTVSRDINVGASRGQIYLSVQNLFNTLPPVYGASPSSSPGYAFPAVPGDDIVGRYFTVGLKLKM